MKDYYTLGNLWSRGYTLKKIAKELDVSPQMVGRVLNGKGKSKRIENHINQILGRVEKVSRNQ